MGVRAEFEKHSNFIAAVLTVVAPILGVWVAVAMGAQGDAESRVDALERQVAADRSTVNSLRGTNDQLQVEIDKKDREIAALKEQVVGDTPETPETPEAPAVRRSGEVTVADDTIDLNAPAEDPTWGANKERGIYAIDGDLSYSWGTVKIEGEYLVPSGKQVSHATCSTATGYQRADSLRPADLEREICVRLDSGRFAAIKMTDWTSDAITLNITTWEKPA